MLLNIKTQPNRTTRDAAPGGSPGCQTAREGGSPAQRAPGPGVRAPQLPRGTSGPRLRTGAAGPGPGGGAVATATGPGPRGRSVRTAERGRPGGLGTPRDEQGREEREEREAVRKDEQLPRLPPAPARTRAGSPAAAVPTL
nr:collagen alpha-1(I) chain-like [Taeniopygia guttata]